MGRGAGGTTPPARDAYVPLRRTRLSIARAVDLADPAAESTLAIGELTEAMDRPAFGHQFERRIERARIERYRLGRAEQALNSVVQVLAPLLGALQHRHELCQFHVNDLFALRGPRKASGDHPKDGGSI